MVDINGYIKLIDMGTAKIMNTETKTYTMIGTPHYIAPEVVQGRGYSYMIDYWALGICMFEFQCGFVPFGEDEDDPFQVYKQILSNKH